MSKLNSLSDVLSFVSDNAERVAHETDELMANFKPETKSIIRGTLLHCVKEQRVYFKQMNTLVLEKPEDVLGVLKQFSRIKKDMNNCYSSSLQFFRITGQTPMSLDNTTIIMDNFNVALVSLVLNALTTYQKGKTGQGIAIKKFIIADGWDLGIQYTYIYPFINQYKDKIDALVSQF
jgi:hypothetical protein